MLLTKVLASAAVVAFVGALSGCASTAPVERHQHQRDAKQGTTMPNAAFSETAPKLLHDHREMK